MAESSKDDDGKVVTRRETDAEKQKPEDRKDELDKRLDEGLEETFPSSDPVSVKVTK